MELNNDFVCHPKQSSCNAGQAPITPPPLEQDEIPDILKFGSPESCQLEMTHQGFDPVSETIPDFVLFCEHLECTKSMTGSLSGRNTTKKKNKKCKTHNEKDQAKE